MMMRGRHSAVEGVLPKQDVVGSNPIARAKLFQQLSISLVKKIHGGDLYGEQTDRARSFSLF